MSNGLQRGLGHRSKMWVRHPIKKDLYVSQVPPRGINVHHHLICEGFVSLPVLHMKHRSSVNASKILISQPLIVGSVQVFQPHINIFVFYSLKGNHELS